jgi:hypothetical protein
MKTRWAIVIAAGVALLAAGCSFGGPPSDSDHRVKETPMMTYQQAVDTVEQLIRETVAALNPQPRLESHGGVRTVPCAGPNDDQETGTSMVEHDYWLRDIDPALSDEILRQVRQYWSDNGYIPVRENGKIGDAFHKIVVSHPDNGFRVSLTVSQGVLIIRSQSNCVPTPES